MLQPKPLETEERRQETIDYYRRCISASPIQTNRAGMTWEFQSPPSIRH